MRIIKQGRLPEDWYCDLVNDCENCGAEYALEKDDPIIGVADDCSWIMSACPTCGQNVTTYRSTAKSVLL